MKDVYQSIVQHYETCFEKHGATPQGVDWPNASDLITRYQVMLEGCDSVGDRIQLLDLGCGYGGLYDHLQKTGLNQFIYHGIDLSAPMIDYAKQQYPHAQFELRDILVQPFANNTFDFVCMNGLLTEKLANSHEDMIAYATMLITQAFRMARCGVIFNVMNEHVDWKRDDLFYWPFDHLANVLREQCSRHFTFRADYGLYEYMIYLYKNKRGER